MGPWPWSLPPKPYRFLVYEFSLYIIWLLAFITFSLLFESEDDSATLVQLLLSPKGLATVASGAVAVAAMVRARGGGEGRGGGGA